MRLNWIVAVAAAIALFSGRPAAAEGKSVKWPDNIQVIVDNTQPLRYSHGKRLQLYVWPAQAPAKLDAARAEAIVRELERRGIGLVSSWNWGDKEQSLANALVVARAQKRLGVRINIDASSCLYSLFDGNPRTAHIDDAGKPFWDDSFGQKNMGCPFALDFRRDAIRERIAFFAEAYKREGLEPGFVFTDWEIDGPIEWNGAWEASKRCRVCREHIPGIDNFLNFQKAIRELRGDLQRDIYAEPLLSRFPHALVGNYAVNPHDGFRYWFDYFEKDVPAAPALTDQNARYRHWSDEFQRAGYTFAMPVAYTWDRIWRSYDFEPGDYRWFYNMLLEASSVGSSTPRGVPIVSFVHWHTVEVSPHDPALKQMSESAYQELLWHMLLRGTSTFFMWCMQSENAKEVQLVYRVWADAQQYGDFLDRGTPISFDVPKRPGTVVSGLLLGDRVLVRRTDFTESRDPVEVRVSGKMLQVPRLDGHCQILTLR